MPTVVIDNQPHEYEPGAKLLQFCLDRGIEIPNFCYHPALSIPANCRQCLVQIGNPAIDRATGQPQLDAEGKPVVQFMPKLMPSCMIDITDGMVVRTQNSEEIVRAAQEDNLEIMLANHPLDCPICDQAGHCPLQIQAYKYGPEGSRFEFEKVHKPKRVRLGPNVTLDAERCINCTRCTRFTEEVSGSHQLSIIARGDKNYPMVAPGTEFDDPYSMCTTDLCPVGALTESYFRFKSRIWDMAATESISAFGSRGINVEYWTRDNLILRITPRQNMDVNEYWMPDAARLVLNTYNENRPAGPQVRTGDGIPGPAAWDRAFDQAAILLKRYRGKIAFLGSAHATVEDNYLLMKLAEGLGADTPSYIPHVKEGAGDDWLMTDDQAPNAAGCERLGMRPVDAEALRAAVASGSIEVLYVLDDDPVAAGLFRGEDLRGVHVILHHYHVTNRTLAHAEVALPAAMVVETIGTYVNDRGRAQRVRPAKAVRGVNRNLMMEMGQSRLDQQGTPFDRWHNETNRVDCKPGWEIIPEIAERLSQPMRYKSPRAIMQEITERVPAFAGATYEAMGLHGYPLEDVTTPA